MNWIDLIGENIGVIGTLTSAVVFGLIGPILARRSERKWELKRRFVDRAARYDDEVMLRPVIEFLDDYLKALFTPVVQAQRGEAFDFDDVDEVVRRFGPVKARMMNLRHTDQLVQGLHELIADVHPIVREKLEAGEVGDAAEHAELASIMVGMMLVFLRPEDPHRTLRQRIRTWKFARRLGKQGPGSAISDTENTEKAGA